MSKIIRLCNQYRKSNETIIFFTKSLKSDVYVVLTAQFNSYLPHFKTHITNGHDIEQSSFCTFSENNLCHYLLSWGAQCLCSPN